MLLIPDGRKIVVTLLALGCLLAGCGTGSGDAQPGTGVEEWPAHEFEQALAPRTFSFPEDHGPHPGFRDEWWYVTGNLWDQHRNRYGFQLTLFRRALQPGLATAAAGQTYMGHFALTDVAGGRFYHSERFGRPLAGIAGSGHAPPRAWLDDWLLEWRQDHWQMSTRHGQWALDLRLTPAFAPILQGDGGFSRKNEQTGNASFYYAQPRLQASGTLERPAPHPGEPHRADRVDGLAWLDREWGSSQLAPEQQGWDWFALQLDDGRALMIYQLRDRDGRADRYSAGSLVSADGRKLHLGHSDFALQPLDYWNSPDGARIPIRWQLRIPAQNIDWQVAAVHPAQYLDGVFPYWEGAVDVTADGDTVGVGYLEMTGYGSD